MRRFLPLRGRSALIALAMGFLVLPVAPAVASAAASSVKGSTHAHVRAKQKPHRRGTACGKAARHHHAACRKPAETTNYTAMDVTPPDVINPCNLEPVVMLGNFHIVFSISTDATGARYLTVITNWQNVHGTGSTTGVGYTAADNTYYSSRQVDDTTAFYDSQEQELISATGIVPNFYLRFVLREQGGTVTAYRLDTYCTSTGGVYSISL